MTEPEDLDIRQAAYKLDPAIDILLILGKREELLRTVLLRAYILETWRMEQELEDRSDHIESETKALAAVFRELWEKGLINDERYDAGRGSDS